MGDSQAGYSSEAEIEVSTSWHYIDACIRAACIKLRSFPKIPSRFRQQLARATIRLFRSIWSWLAVPGKKLRMAALWSMQ